VIVQLNTLSAHWAASYFFPGESDPEGKNQPESWKVRYQVSLERLMVPAASKPRMGLYSLATKLNIYLTLQMFLSFQKKGVPELSGSLKR